MATIIINTGLQALIECFGNVISSIIFSETHRNLSMVWKTVNECVFYDSESTSTDRVTSQNWPPDCYLRFGVPQKGGGEYLFKSL